MIVLSSSPTSSSQDRRPSKHDFRDRGDSTCGRGILLFLSLVIALHTEKIGSAVQIDQEDVYVGDSTSSSSTDLSQKFPGRMSMELQESLRGLSQSHSTSIVRITSASQRTILGTVISKDGLILTKASELDREIQCELFNGDRASGTLVATNRDRDLALIRIPISGLKPIQFSLSRPVQGDLVVSPGSNAQILGLGIVSLNKHDLGIKQSTVSLETLLGLQMTDTTHARTLVVDNKYVEKLGLRVLRVEPRSVGEQANLLIDDLICSINGKRTFNQESWMAATRSIAVGKNVIFEVIRNDRLFEVSVAVKNLDRTPHDKWGGGPFSHRRFELGEIIIHDTPISADDCGGPILNGKGEVVGINIARALRVATFAVAVEDVVAWVQQAVPEAKLEINSEPQSFP